MITQISHVPARCGAGKSRETINELAHYIQSQPAVNDTWLFASKTNVLTDQNYRSMQDAIQRHPENRPLPIERVDSITHKNTVSRDLHDLIDRPFRGVIFISHSTLASLSEHELVGKRIIVDEVPNELAGCLMVQHAAQDHNYPWDKYLTEVPSRHRGYTAVEIKPDADRDDIIRYAAAIRRQQDTATTRNVADLLTFLLQGYEAVYTTTQHSDGTLMRKYQAVHYHRLKELATHAHSLYILSAQLKQTLFGYIAEHHLGLPIVERDITDQFRLVQKHQQTARIIPLLDQGRWSTALRAEPADQALTKNGQPVRSTLTVRQFAQAFADRHLRDKDYLITLNTKDELLPGLTRPGVTRTSTAIHGMNHLRTVDHAAYLASTNPTPFDVKSLRMFALDRRLNADGLISAVMVERCYETAYQCIARTSIRNASADPEKEHIFIVPDIHYANYLQSWFESGFATIYTRDSYQRTRSDTVKMSRTDHYRPIIIHILTEARHKKGTIKALIKDAGISYSTFKRYREILRTELEAADLIKPKRSSQSTVPARA